MAKRSYLVTLTLLLIISLSLARAFAHTNSIGFQSSNSSAASCTVGSGSNCVNIEVFMGTYHRNSAAEGHAALFLQNGDGTEGQVLGQSAPGGSRINFTLSHSLLSELPNFDGSNYWDSGSQAFRNLSREFELGSNYYFADGSNKSLTSTPSNPDLTWGSFPYIFGHQSATFNDVGAGIYRLDYDAGSPEGKADLGFDWYALPGISEAFFRVKGDGTVSIVMNPAQFLEFASFSDVLSLDNAANALEDIRPAIRTTSTDVGAFFEQLYNMPVKEFYGAMKVISGDIHGQVNETILSDLAVNSNSEMKYFIRNQENDKRWTYIYEVSSSEQETARVIGNSVNGSGISVGKNWQDENKNFFGLSVAVNQQDLRSVSGTASISTSTFNSYFGKRFKNFEINNVLGVSASNIKTSRRVNLDNMTNSHTSSYDYQSVFIRSEFGKNIQKNDNVSLRPSVGLSYLYSLADEFSETGSSISKLVGVKEKLEQQQVFAKQEVVINNDLFGLNSQLTFVVGANKQILNSVDREGRTVLLHDANWDVGIPFDRHLSIETEANIDVKLNKNLKLNTGVTKHLSSNNESKVMFSISGIF